MDPQALVIFSALAFVIGFLSWAVPAWKYHTQTKVGVFAVALLFAGLVLMTTFKWSDIALEVSGATLKISELQEELDATKIAFARIQRTQSAALETNLTKAFAEQGLTVDSGIVKRIAAETVEQTPYWVMPSVDKNKLKNENVDPAKLEDLRKKFQEMLPNKGEQPPAQE